MTAPNEADLYNDVPEGDDTIKWARKAVNTRTIRSSHEYKVAHDAYRLQCATHRQPDGTLGDPCIRCVEPIDYNLQYPHPRSWSLEHLIPVSERPELLLDRNNFASAHFACNSVAGDSEIESDLGEISEEW